MIVPKNKEFLFEALTYLFIIVICVIFFGKGLQLNSSTMFLVQDSTQPARIEQFILNLKNLQFPPRIAPEMSFRMGWPLYNLYAPTSYWIASAIYFLTGFSIINTICMSYLVAILCGFLLSYLFFRLYFNRKSSLFGSILYGSSTYISIDIFCSRRISRNMVYRPFSSPFLYRCKGWAKKLTVFI